MTAPFAGRREDLRFLTGRGRYTSDHSLPGELHAAFRRSDHAHAILRSVDKGAAERAPGVVAVFAGADLADAPFRTLPPSVHFPGRGGSHILVPERPVLARDRLRFVGEEVAVVIAASAQAAADAAELIEIDADPLPAVIGFERALAPDAPAIHDSVPGNLCFDFDYGDEAKMRAAIAAAEHVVRLTLESPRVAPTPMEIRAALASYDPASDTYSIRVAHQGGPAMRDALAVMLGVAPQKIRVERVDVGGAFGARTAPFPEYPLLLHLARRLGRPIRWSSTRTQDFLTDNHGRAVRVAGELAFDKDGRFLALRTDWLCDCGAYLSQAGVLTNSMNGQQMGAGVYRVPAVYGRHRHVLTNTSPTNAYRGAGRPEAAYIVERLVDEAAAVLKIDPFALRRRNLIAREEMPYRTATGSVFDSGDFSGLAAKAEALGDWRSFAQRRAEAASRGKLRGIGCTLFLEPSGGGGVPKDQVAIRFDEQGRAILYTVTGASGQGHETVFAELVAGWLGLDPARVEVRAGDPDGPELQGAPAIGSRSTLSQGSVFKSAAEEVIRKGLALAADALETASGDVEFRDGRYLVRGTDRAVSLGDIIDRHIRPGAHPLDSDAELVPQRTFPSGAHVAEVEIDRETGAVALVAYTAVDDLGTVVSPVLAEGQLHGGVVQGAGQAFGEACVYDEASGQLLSATFMDYVMPHADLPGEFRVGDHSVPTPGNRLGAKGAGEAGTTGSLATCMNAVLDALRPLGISHFDMPATSARLWAAIKEKEES